MVSLGPGEPDFTPQPHILAAAKRALTEKQTRYTSPQGTPELRDAVVRKLLKENKIRTTADNVLITNGATEGILLTLMATIDPGEGVLLPDPSFLAYKPAVEVLSGTPLMVRLRETDGFQLTWEDLERAILPEKTNVLILNTPGNPTGVVFSKKVLEEIADFAVEYDLLIVADEVYEKFVYANQKHISIGSLNGMQNRVVTINSFSKTYGMPGFRVGYLTGPEKFINSMTKLHIFSSICAGSVSQAAALAALRGPQKAIPRIVRDYDKRRKEMVRRVNTMPGLRCREPGGAFYVFVNCSKIAKHSYPFAQNLLTKAKVAVVPGIEFGRGGEGFIRLSYATAPQLIRKGLDRMEDFLMRRRT